ncbi:MAG: zinc ABC transporter substrate-binding protein, partial [Chloroflexi bacterium]|nr:zinc ABC transporter substrate-binding protein [Chloroflexota bacterium]
MLLLATVLAAAAIVACSDDDDDTADTTTTTTTTTTAPATQEPIKVVTSTGILAHFAEQVAGDDAEVVAVIPPGADTHTFSASTGDIRNIAAANVVIVNGFNLEEGTLETIF